MNQIIDIGYLSKIHGYKGQFNFILDEDVEIDVSQVEFVFFMIDQKPVPFYVEEFRDKGNGFLLKVEGIDGEDKAKRYIGTTIGVEEEDITELKEGKFWEYLVGFKVIDQKHGEVGVIEEVQEHAGNIVASIMINEQEVMLPIHDQFITDIDQENEVLHYQAPEGLIDLYLNK